ncbi:MAG: hypothetical protein PHF86_08245 [Candidatus Nanoarchaeia archaeon]|nr:hypothetical protein [Candidatus Nanoarchaeia archaeon]
MTERIKDKVERYKVTYNNSFNTYMVLKSNGNGDFHSKGSSYEERGIYNRIITIVREEGSEVVFDKSVPVNIRSKLEEIVDKFRE